ncbi:MAG: glycosyltransferase [Pseudolabrys sp.]|jgi:hopene-associated glycosyltransferase HpnB
MITVVAIICVAIWAYLLCARGMYWRAGVHDATRIAGVPGVWPTVAVVIPARNESECIALSVQSLLRQDYRGPFTVVVVDDDSDDSTGAVATVAAAGDRRLSVIRTTGPAAGWTGKLWAVSQGIAAAEASHPEYLLLTDADIEHAPDTLSWLVSQSMAGRFVLTSLMAKLRCVNLAEKIHVPAFIYFFQMLYPFAWVARADSSTAAAAGGCMLVRADALASVGGIASIRGALIDDCSLGAKLKTVGPIWLGLTNRVQSIRPYPTFADVARMVTRSAYSQLRYSLLALTATTLGMAITFVAPLMLALFASGLPRYLGLLAWAAMSLSFVPTLLYYRLSPIWSAALPGIALLYMSYTLQSAYQHFRRRGGQWKGRVHADAPSVQ